MIAEATDGVNVGLNLPHPLLLQGFGGIYVNMNGNEVLPRLLSKPLLLMTSVF